MELSDSPPRVNENNFLKGKRGMRWKVNEHEFICLVYSEIALFPPNPLALFSSLYVSLLHTLASSLTSVFM